MASKFAGAILNHVNDLPSFTARDVGYHFSSVSFNIIKESIKELVEDKKIFPYGVKRGTFYSVNPNLTEEEQSEELSPRLLQEVKEFILSRRDFCSSDLFAYLPKYQEHILRKALVYFRDEEEILHLHGHGKSSIWSQHEELPDKEEEIEEANDLKSLILEFAKTNLRWFKRAEIDELIPDVNSYEIRKTLYELMDDGDIQMRGEKRATEYAYYEVVTTDESEEVEKIANPNLKNNILDYIKTIGIVTVPQLITKFEVARSEIILALQELEEDEEIYHEGIKKSSRYLHKDVTETKAITILKEQREEKKELPTQDAAIDQLSSLLIMYSAVYITFINESMKYELRCVSALKGGVKVLFASENADEVIQHMFDLTNITKGVELELVK